MPAYRFFNDQPLKTSQKLLLEGLEHKHLKQVMRKEVGDEVEIADGKGTLAVAKVLLFKKSETLLEIQKVTFLPKKHELVLYQAMPKATKLDLIVEKGTELGLSKIYLFMGERSIQKPTAVKLDRLKSIAVSALKQSGRLYLPEIELISPIGEWDKTVSNAFYGEVTQAPLLQNALGEVQNLHSLSFCNGPEAGFSKKETLHLQKIHFKGVSLHSNILRTETAPLIFLSLAFNHLLAKGNTAIVN